MDDIISSLLPRMFLPQLLLLLVCSRCCNSRHVMLCCTSRPPPTHPFPLDIGVAMAAETKPQPQPKWYLNLNDSRGIIVSDAALSTGTCSADASTPPLIQGEMSVANGFIALTNDKGDDMKPTSASLAYMDTINGTDMTAKHKSRSSWNYYGDYGIDENIRTFPLLSPPPDDDKHHVPDALHFGRFYILSSPCIYQPQYYVFGKSI
jgi:hypothetical protein